MHSYIYFTQYDSQVYYRIGRMMMGHILIFMYMIALLVGTWAAFQTHQAHKLYRMDLLRHFLNYTLSFCLSLFVYQISEYVFFNIIGRQQDHFPPGLTVIITLFAFIVEIGMSYSLVKTGMRLLGRDSLKKFDHGFIAAASLFGASLIVGVTLFTQTGSTDWLVMTYRVLAMAAVLTIYTGMVITLVCRNPDLTTLKKKAVRVFAVLYLTKYSLTFMSMAIPEPVRHYFVGIALILANVIPIFWLRQYFVKYYVDIDSTKTEGILEMLKEEYRISRRELEIIELILKGKSNKEIEDILCISFSTVKNHIYNVYQKMGINSRGQLMHMVMEFPKQQDA